MVAITIHFLNEFTQTEIRKDMKKQCKNCGSNTEQFNIDYEEGLIRCFYCNQVLPNEMFFNDLTVNQFAKKIPEERRDEFMAKLGFEKKPVHKSFNIGFYLLGLIPIIFGAFIKGINNQDNMEKLIPLILTGIVFFVTVIKVHMDRNKMKYVRKG